MAENIEEIKDEDLEKVSGGGKRYGVKTVYRVWCDQCGGYVTEEYDTEEECENAANDHCRYNNYQHSCYAKKTYSW